MFRLLALLVVGWVGHAEPVSAGAAINQSPAPDSAASVEGLAEDLAKILVHASFSGWATIDTVFFPIPSAGIGNYTLIISDSMMTPRTLMVYSLQAPVVHTPGTYVFYYGKMLPDQTWGDQVKAVRFWGTILPAECDPSGHRFLFLPSYNHASPGPLTKVPYATIKRKLWQLHDGRSRDVSSGSKKVWD